MTNRPRNRPIGLTIGALRLWTRGRKRGKDSRDRRPAIIGNT
jgi:hypothetical protein